MKNSEQPNDIATEPYQGPGKTVTSAGYLYISHGLSVVGGFLALGAIGALAHTQTAAIKQWAQKMSAAQADAGVITKGFAKLIGVASSIAESAAHKVFSGLKKLAGSRFQGKSLGEERAAAGLFAGGFGAITGYVGSTLWGIVKGIHEGDKGKHQFERAQQKSKTCAS